MLLCILASLTQNLFSFVCLIFRGLKSIWNITMLQTLLYSAVCNIVMLKEKATKLRATIVHRKLLENQSCLTTLTTLNLPISGQFWQVKLWIYGNSWVSTSGVWVSRFEIRSSRDACDSDTWIVHKFSEPVTPVEHVFFTLMLSKLPVHQIW